MLGVIVAVLLFVFERLTRQIEVGIASWVFPLVFAEDALPVTSGGMPGVAFGHNGWYALIITPECSIAFYVGALVLLGAALLLIPRFQMSRILLAVAVSSLGMIALNQVRLAALGFIRAEYGGQAFDWAHTLGGSFLMMAGLAGCLALFFVVVVRGGRSVVR